RLVAIDHGHSDLYTQPTEATYMGVSLLLRHPDVLDRLAALDEKEFTQRVSGTVPARFLRPLFARRAYLIRALSAYDRLRKATRDDVGKWLAEEVGQLSPITHGNGYLSPNGQVLVDWLQRIVDGTPHGNYACLALIETLAPAHEAGRLSGRDFRRVLARVL